MFKTQQIKLTDNIPDELNDFLVHLCENASSLVNCVIYQIKQKHFESCERTKFFDRDAVNKTARFVVNYCLTNKIGHVVFGWGQGIKDKIQLGKKHNQNFVQIPTAKLKDRIRQLCEETGIQFHETEESYTSKTSFLDDDFLPTLGEKPQGWKPSGKRGKKGDGIGRGQYKTATGLLINSDCQGAINIVRKVATQVGLVLSKVGREALVLPKRFSVFNSMKRTYRQRCYVGFYPA